MQGVFIIEQNSRLFVFFLSFKHAYFHSWIIYLWAFDILHCFSLSYWSPCAALGKVYTKEEDVGLQGIWIPTWDIQKNGKTTSKEIALQHRMQPVQIGRGRQVRRDDALRQSEDSWKETPCHTPLLCRVIERCPYVSLVVEWRSSGRNLESEADTKTRWSFQKWHISASRNDIRDLNHFSPAIPLRITVNRNSELKIKCIHLKASRY